MNHICNKSRGIDKPHAPRPVRLAAGLVALALTTTTGLLGCRSSNTSHQPPARSTTPSFQGRVPTPPTADQISPSSPAAVLNGTSTTQTSPRTPQLPTQPSSPPPFSPQPSSQPNPSTPQ